jgi:hypothetical protein
MPLQAQTEPTEPAREKACTHFSTLMVQIRLKVSGRA